MNYTFHYESPLGGITLASDGLALTGLWFDDQKFYAGTLGTEFEEKRLPVFEETVRWLDLYFDGRIPEFTPALSFRATPFRKTVWDILLTIPYGKTLTYGEIARMVSPEKRMSAQAVGGAVGRNPISLIVPCHRVVGSNGQLTGYAGGLEKKAWLLRLEKQTLSGSFPDTP